MSETTRTDFAVGENVLIVGDFFATTHLGQTGYVGDVIPSYYGEGLDGYKVMLDPPDQSTVPSITAGSHEIALIEPKPFIGSRVYILDTAEMVERRGYMGYISGFSRDSIFPYKVSFIAFDTVALKRAEFSVIYTNETMRTRFIAGMERIESMKRMAIQAYLKL